RTLRSPRNTGLVLAFAVPHFRSKGFCLGGKQDLQVSMETPDDRIGCGVKLRSGTVFFTVNGKNIGAATVASQGAWHFCVGFHSKESVQAVTFHYTPTDWKFDPFVKICVPTCENCSSAGFPACGVHESLLTNFSEEGSVASCAGQSGCVSTKYNWKICA
ncbi:hypothetical protein BC938DRAFT_471462, partial [Jimgerdemannia flammicorona]